MSPTDQPTPASQRSLAREQFHRANALREAGQVDAAIQELRAAIAADPEFAEAYVNLGHLLERAAGLADAAAMYERAIALQPGLADAHRNLGAVRFKLGDLGAALASFERVVTLRPEAADAHLGLSAVHRLRNEFDAAIAACERALAVSPGSAAAWINLANIYRAQNRIAAARAASERALALAPDSPQANINHAMVELVAGNLRAGWPHAEARHAMKLAGAGREFAQPQWRGAEPLAGRRILLHAEQGLGDTLLFVRFVPLVAALGASVFLQVQRPLRELLEASFGGCARLLTFGEPLPDFDLHCPLPSLPLAFGTDLASLPAQVPYVRVPADAMGRWRNRLPTKGTLRVGLAWAGNPSHPNDANRSMPLETLRPLWTRVGGATFHSLKKEMSPTDAEILRSTPEVVDLAPRLENFGDTAAAIAELDLVIAVDTSVAHLAGALGRPVWILLPFSPDWRWLLERDDSPWYPTARLFRQSRTAAWDPVIDRVVSELSALVGSANKLRV
ncbi:MAG TPA: tetratricopeptide repeat-containing glycosyltransferase family protein [Opitutaceae bacterium]|nr:tetratricopeptide repeat-containing glycosyltransferase family protein [Opitutaceae bacterium]